MYSPAVLGALHIVATPIGNLEDITLRALRVLKEVDLIACEDTRVTRKLLNAHGIETPLVSFHAHSDAASLGRLIEKLQAGENLALVSDAGTPLISDPGELLVQRAVEAGAKVIPIPGASAMIAALSACGLPAQPALFMGFLPRSEKARRERLSPLRSAVYTLVFYEAPSRLRDTLVQLEKSLGDREACVARELSKRFETFERGKLSALVERFESPPKGEITIVVGPASAQPEVSGVDAAKAQAARLLQAGGRSSDVAKTIAGAFGMAKREAYQLVLQIQSESRDDEVPPS